MSNVADHSQHLEGGLAVAAVKVSPPAIVSGLTLFGVSVQDWLIILTIIYTLIMIVIALPRMKQSFKEWRKK